MRWLVLIALWCNIATAQVVVQHNIPDDGYVRVPLQFPFPYYNRVFTESFMFSNGVVGFLNTSNSWCCTGFNLETSVGSPFSYAIMPLQTDLINYGMGQFVTEGTTQYQKYRWENISEFGVPNNLNTFGVEIRPSGYIGMYYEQVNISPWRPVTRGMTGDTTAGEYTQYYHGPGYSSIENVGYITQNTGDRCAVDVLSSPSCPGYQLAFYNQQCTVNPLYDSGCYGYAEAHFNQQCSSSALYDRRCPGYQAAYALANIVSTPKPVVSRPALQISSSGRVSIETPVVSDTVVNEVITRPNANTSVQQTNQEPNRPASVQTEPKTEKKTESKPPAQTRKAESKNEVTNKAPTIVDVQIKQPSVLIIDMMYKQLIKKPIQDNNRAYYALIMGSQKTHEEMVDEQYRR